MLESDIVYFFIFHTIHDVLRAEGALKSRGATFELVPVPRVLSSDCGVCIRSGKQADDTLSLLNSLNLDRCFFFNGKDYVQIDVERMEALPGKEIEGAEY